MPREATVGRFTRSPPTGPVRATENAFKDMYARGERFTPFVGLDQALKDAVSRTKLSHITERHGPAVLGGPGKLRPSLQVSSSARHSRISGRVGKGFNGVPEYPAKECLPTKRSFKIHPLQRLVSPCSLVWGTGKDQLSTSEPSELSRTCILDPGFSATPFGNTLLNTR